MFPYERVEAPRLHRSIPLAKIYPNKAQEHSDPKFDFVLFRTWHLEVLATGGFSDWGRPAGPHFSLEREVTSRWNERLGLPLGSGWAPRS